MPARKNSITQQPKSPGHALTEDIDTLRAAHPKVTEDQALVVDTLLATGCSQRELSKLTGKEQGWISRTLRKEHVIAYMNELGQHALGTLAARAIANFPELLHSKSHSVRLEAIKDVLDRAGYGVENKQRAAQQVAVVLKLE